VCSEQGRAVPGATDRGRGAGITTSTGTRQAPGDERGEQAQEKQGGTHRRAGRWAWLVVEKMLAPYYCENIFIR